MQAWDLMHEECFPIWEEKKYFLLEHPIKTCNISKCKSANNIFAAVYSDVEDVKNIN